MARVEIDSLTQLFFWQAVAASAMDHSEQRRSLSHHPNEHCKPQKRLNSRHARR
jgi:hypothetical protein